MSLDCKYIIQYEGPFGKHEDGTDEWQNQLERLNAIKGSFGFKEFGYETIIGETKNSHDEEIVEIAKKSSPIQILRRLDFGKWEEIDF